MDGGAWWAAVHGVAKSWTRLKRLDFHFSLSCIGEGNGNPVQCSGLENPRDSGAWWAAVCGVAQSWTRLKRLSSSSPKLKVVRRAPLTGAGSYIFVDKILKQSKKWSDGCSLSWCLIWGSPVGCDWMFLCFTFWIPVHD